MFEIVRDDAVMEYSFFFFLKKHFLEKSSSLLLQRDNFILLQPRVTVLSGILNNFRVFLDTCNGK